MNHGLSRLLPGGRRSTATRGTTEEAQAAAAEDDEDKPKTEEGVSGEAEEEQSESQAQDGEDEEDEEDEDDEDDSEKEDEASSPQARERARVAAILNCKEGKTRPQAARQLALETDLSAGKARKVLAGMPAEPRRGDLTARMAQERTAPVGGDGGAGSSASEADRGAAGIIAAGKATDRLRVVE